jgi:hypothetical protein
VQVIWPNVGFLGCLGELLEPESHRQQLHVPSMLVWKGFVVCSSGRDIDRLAPRTDFVITALNTHCSFRIGYYQVRGATVAASAIVGWLRFHGVGVVSLHDKRGERWELMSLDRAR